MTPDKLKVVLFSVHDWANSGYRLHEAVNRHSDKFHVTYYAAHTHPFNYYRGDNVIVQDGHVHHEVLARLEKDLAEADLIHYKGDDCVVKRVEGVDFPMDKPIMVTVGGRYFRDHTTELYDKQTAVVKLWTGTTPDLLVRDGMKLMPFAFPEERAFGHQVDGGIIFIGHSPSKKSVKGTEHVMQSIDFVQRDHPNVMPNIQHGMPYDVALQLKRLNHIFVDQLSGFGSYGNSGTEAMAFGAAVVSDCHAPGVVYADKDCLTDVLMELVEDEELRRQCAAQSKQQYLDTHCYKVVAAKAEKYYQEVLS
jgi:hypothetical protein